MRLTEVIGSSEDQEKKKDAQDEVERLSAVRSRHKKEIQRLEGLKQIQVEAPVTTTCSTVMFPQKRTQQNTTKLIAVPAKPPKDTHSKDIYIYIYTRTRTCTHSKDIYTHSHTDTQTHTHTHSIYTHRHTQTSIYMYRHTHTHTERERKTHTHTHT